ncbi:MAG: AraC family transcriptional regulator [Pseudomonadota bacterium]
MPLKSLTEAVSVFLEGRPNAGYGVQTGVKDLWIYANEAPTAIDAVIYTPIVSLTLQGEKETRWGGRRRVFRPGESFIVSHDLPVRSCVTRASKTEPFMALALNIDLPLLRTLSNELSEPLSGEVPAQVIETDVADDTFLGALGRYFALHDNAKSARLLAPIVHKELHALLLLAPHAGMLRRLLNRESQASQIARAIAHIRENLSQSLTVGDLANLSGMSVRSFHAYFKSVTSTTPLQYQKELRLIEARRLIQAEGKAVGTAAFEVGYESPTQFSREFSRRFGLAPSRINISATEGLHNI